MHESPLDPWIERALRRDRLIVLTGLVTAILLAWVYLLAVPGMEMSTSGAMADMEMPVEPGFAAFFLMFIMWWVMMVAMMLPSAAPMILLFGAITRKRQGLASPYPPLVFFTLGYLLVWGGFSVAATLAQGALSETQIFHQSLRITSPYLNGALLLGAGLWQLSPVKRTCLRHCRSPVHYLTTHWRMGSTGALQMGAGHGVFCFGCCWFLMALLFVGGIMNPYWIMGIAAYVLLEKLAPKGEAFARISGAVLIMAGLWLIVTPLIPGL